MTATREDGQMLLGLLSFGVSLGAMEAARTVFDDSFDPETASLDNDDVGKVLMFNETLGTFVKQGLVDASLVYDMWWVEGIWKRVGPYARRLRESAGEPRLYENFELLAANAPGA
ncbi:MAG TPA: DUF4760 domain-containing protein [Acidimicrobiales bacterium]|nr:MAG: hypothetical protein B7Z69_06910 [Actinobacteria bacterium 21-73-9]HQU26286.1 DUF4760 domain-containing protein [Acidimicrobiales bacterium]